MLIKLYFLISTADEKNIRRHLFKNHHIFLTLINLLNIYHVYSLPSDFFDNKPKPSGGQHNSLGLSSYSSDEEEEDDDEDVGKGREVTQTSAASSLKSVQLSHPALPAGLYFSQIIWNYNTYYIVHCIHLYFHYMANLHEKSPIPPPPPIPIKKKHWIFGTIRFLSSRKTFTTFQAFPTEFGKTHYLLSSAEKVAIG